MMHGDYWCIPLCIDQEAGYPCVGFYLTMIGILSNQVNMGRDLQRRLCTKIQKNDNFVSVSKIDLFLFYAHKYLPVCMYICIVCGCLVTMENKRGHQILWNWRCELEQPCRYGDPILDPLQRKASHQLSHLQARAYWLCL